MRKIYIRILDLLKIYLGTAIIIQVQDKMKKKYLDLLQQKIKINQTYYYKKITIFKIKRARARL